MIKMFIKKWQKEEQEKKERILQLKINEIRYWTTRFFEDLNVTKGTVCLPAWVECKNLMEKLNINKDNPQVVNFYFRRLKKHKVSI